LIYGSFYYLDILFNESKKLFLFVFKTGVLAFYIEVQKLHLFGNLSRFNGLVKILPHMLKDTSMIKIG
jgi:hypothetical protein